MIVSVEIARLSNQNTHLIKETETLSSNMEKVSQKAGSMVEETVTQLLGLSLSIV